MRKYGKWLLVLGILAGSPSWAGAEGLRRIGQDLPASRSVQQERNQRKAEEIGRALTSARVNGYDLSVEVRENAVKLDGKVRDVTHKALAEKVCLSVAGIDRVVNNLSYSPGGRIQQTSGRVADSSLKPAVYTSESEVSRNEIEQVHFQKPGKKSRSTGSNSSVGNPFSRFFKSRREAAAQQQQSAARSRTTAQQRTNSQQRSATRPTATTKSTAGLQRSGSQPRQNTAAQGSSRPQQPAARPQMFVDRSKAATTKPQPTPLTSTASRNPAAELPSAPAFNPPEVPPTTPQPRPAQQPKQELPVEKSVSAAAFAPQPRPVAQRQLQQAPAGPNNQEVAQEIALALAKVGLVGYDVEIRYESGIATLNGEVATVDQMRNAEFAASQVTEVQNVKNNLQVSGPIARTSFGPENGSKIRPATMVMPMPVPMMMGNSMNAGPHPVAAAGNYSNPNLPNHAWPAYAAYPNSAAISYPKQYSPSAWPYIGPFYPYPQVPMGWREVSLQWDDGHWQLDFEKKHNAWYWLWNPANWQ